MIYEAIPESESASASVDHPSKGDIGEVVKRAFVSTTNIGMDTWEPTLLEFCAVSNRGSFLQFRNIKKGGFEGGAAFFERQGLESRDDQRFPLAFSGEWISRRFCEIMSEIERIPRLICLLIGMGKDVS